MSPRKISALCFLWQVFHLATCSISYTKYSNLKAINWGLPLAGHKLYATPMAASMVTSRMKCMAQCGKTEGCVAINLGPPQAGEHECQLLDTTRYSPSMTNFTSQAGWTYVGPKSKCDTNPCSKKLLCIAHAQREVDLYTCLDLANVATCQDYRDAGFTTSGIYTLSRGGQLVPTYCDQEDDGGGWTVFLRNDAQDSDIFNTDWPSYQHGFGNLNSNFWWGNEKLHQETKAVPHVLKVDLKKSTPTKTTGYSQYTGFQIADKDDGYRLSFDVDSYSGNGGDSLPHHNQKKFSTPETDFDDTVANCAAERKCGWWFGSCAYAVPTKVWIHWGTWNPEFIELKIRPM